MLMDLSRQRAAEEDDQPAVVTAKT
jgi:hypothetical protein